MNIASLSLRFNDHFLSDGFIALRMMEVVMTTGAIRRAKLQSNRHHQQNTQLLQNTNQIQFQLKLPLRPR